MRKGPASPGGRAGAGGAPGWAFALAGLAGLTALLWARHLDVTRGTAVLHYDLEADAARTFSQLRAAFAQLAGCRAVWHVEASAAAGDARRQAGAGTLVKRRPIPPAPASTPPRVACNLAVPALPAGRQTLYFFPDRVLVYEQKRVGAVPYGALVATRREDGSSRRGWCRPTQRWWRRPDSTYGRTGVRTAGSGTTRSCRSSATAGSA